MSIQSFEADRMNRDKAAGTKGLSTLLNTVGGGVSGFLTGGPAGAVVGAGMGLAGSLVPQVKDAQGALQKFMAWKNTQPSPAGPSLTPDYMKMLG
jgi:hypothetical protein